MRIQFSTQFGPDVWDGTAKSAVFNVDTCNSIQLIGHLETALGLPTLHPAPSARAASLLATLLDDETAYYHRSACNDALGCARRLLHDYDTLRLHGWQPSPVDTPRLRQLAAACANASPGRADRLHAIVAAQPQRKASVDAVLLHEPMASLPTLWRQVFDKLQAAGTRIETAPMPQAVGHGDLAWASRRAGNPSGDGTLQLLIAPGPLEAADHVAAWLAADALDDTVIISPTPTLDGALPRHALPTLGLRSHATEPAVQLVPLTVLMAFTPIDPRLAVEFLSISPNPIGWPLRSKLLDALSRWPAVHSSAWSEAVATHAQENAEQAHQDGIALDTFFCPSLQRTNSAYPIALLDERLRALQRFFEPLQPPPFAAMAACERLRAAALAMGRKDISEGQLQRLLAAVLAETPGADVGEAQAGLFPVSNAASLVAPARRIVWWDFTAESVPALRPPPLLHGDMASLRDRGVHLPSAAQRASDAASAWRLPLLHAREALLLVTPRTSATGEKTHPHPLWDEMAAAIPSAQRAVALSKLVVKRPTYGGQALPTVRRPLRRLPLPMSTLLHVTSRALKRDGPESPHSMETMLGCSVRWALNYLANIQAARIPAIKVTPLQTGSFAHHLLESLVMAPLTSPEESAEQARILFDSEAPQHLAPLYLPGNTPARHDMRVAFADAVRKLTEIRHAHGWRIAESELMVSKPFHTITLRGILDARLDNPLGVIDFKWSGSTKYRNMLKESTAMQLAIYSYLCAEDDNKLPPIAYFILDRAKLLTPEVGAVKGAFPLARASVSATWDACKAAMIQALGRLESGELTAPGNSEMYNAAEKNAVVGGVLQVVAPCIYCDYAALCGMQWRSAP